jgi:hypothetical protein
MTFVFGEWERLFFGFCLEVFDGFEEINGFSRSVGGEIEFCLYV